MPSPPTRHISALVKPVIKEEASQISLEDGELQDRFTEECLKLRNNIEQGNSEELHNSKIRADLEIEQREVKLQITEESNENSQLSSALKSEDAIPPEFPNYAYGTRETSKDRSNTSVYQR